MFELKKVRIKESSNYGGTSRFRPNMYVTLGGNFP